jgi:phosphate starvation-inducible PhoH-like protein
MKLFLTRIGDNCKVIIDGDLEQKDIPSQSGLADAVIRLKHTKKVGVVEFSVEDIVRSGIVKDIIRAYSV